MAPSNLELVDVFPSTIPVLTGLRARGLRLGAVTSRKMTARRTLELTGLMPFLDGVVTGDDVTLHKPDPEGIMKVLAELGAKPSNSIMIGDTASDIKAARNAGLRSVGVTYGFYSPSDFTAFPPDYIIDDLSELCALLETVLT